MAGNLLLSTWPEGPVIWRTPIRNEELHKKNLAIKALNKLVNGTVCSQAQRNATQTKRFAVTVGWMRRGSVGFNFRRQVKRLPRKYGYPPDLQDAAVQNVLQQAEWLVAERAG
jgi:hypothetical protein